MVPERIESALLSLVKEAGERLQLEIVKSEVGRDNEGYDYLPANSAEQNGYRVKATLVWPPDNKDFSEWADIIVRAEELLDKAENEEFDEQLKDQEFQDFLERIEKAKTWSPQ